MPLKTNFIERLLIRTGMIPGALLDVGISGFQVSALIAAGETGLLNHVRDTPRTFEEIRSRTGCSVKGLNAILPCLVHLGYLRQQGDRYVLSKAAVRSFPLDGFAAMVPFFKTNIEAQLRKGTTGLMEDPQGGAIGWEMVKSGEIGRSYQAAMRWIGGTTVDEVASIVRFTEPPKRLLDVGGSHGLYCVRFCRKYPAMNATVLDWPIGIESARQTLAEEKDVADRIDTYEADFEKDPLPSGYDFVFLGNIIHGLTEKGNRALIAKIADAMNGNATIAILDQYSNVKGSPFVKGISSLIGWNLFLFAGGQAYDFSAVRQWLESSGFSSVTLKHLKRSPGFSLVTARKP